MTGAEVITRVDELILELDSPSEALIAISMREDVSQFDQLDFMRHPCTSTEASYIAGLLLESKTKWLNDPVQLGQITHKMSMQFLDPAEDLDWWRISDEIEMYLDSRTSASLRESVFPTVFDELARIAGR
jgi:hypothetical protein